MSEVTAFGYEYLRLNAGKLSPYTRVNLSTQVAFSLAEKSPYPQGVKLGIRKHLANENAVSLRQLSILLGWAADKAQR